MTLSHLSTRSLARAALLVSTVALAVALLGASRAPHSSLPAALAAAPKIELRRILQAHDPAAAVAYYLSKHPEDLATYTHPVLGFSFPYITDFTVDDLQEDRGELVLVQNPAVGMGFQIFITPDDETVPLTAARIRHDLPDLSMDEVVEFSLPDDTASVRFVSHDPLLGDVGETWFRRDGHLFQLSAVAPDRALQDAWIRAIATNFTFSDDGTANASTQQQ
jgi:hypothetical protein